MSAENGWAPPSDFTEMFRDQGREITQLQRRNRTPRARDILGPGIAARAVQLLDWNAEETTFNGIFYSLAGAQNSPDPAAAWIGQVLATPDGSGVMHVVEMATSSYDGAEAREYRRGWRTLANATRQFTAWEQVYEADLPGGVVANLTGPWSGSVPGPTTGTARDCRAGILRGTMSATGYSGTGDVTLELYVDGVLVGTSAITSAASGGVRFTVPSVVFEVPVDAGTHYFAVRQTVGSSNGSDQGHLHATVSNA